MDVLVTITVIDEDGDEIANVSASAHTPLADWSELPAEAFQLALQHLELANADPPGLSAPGRPRSA